ncbi:acyl-[ACP]--phospholipid O-acyltransferase [Pacificispira sp.]|uniref:acyl-[ACP]--phospholipid O-acyltransferase n=1 Tax=Pacificispira sp. TaxID=2888761 RepID=UPI003BAA4403
MAGSLRSVMGNRRFLPLFLTQAFGALNDNLFKQALIVLIAFRLLDGSDMSASAVVSAAAGLFILPYFLFSALAGQLADKYDKSRLIRAVKLVEILIMAFGAVALWLGSLPLLLTALFLMGAQSAFFSPAKYGILPAHLDPADLIPGNALIEAGTFGAILLGTMIGGLLAAQPMGPEIVAACVLAIAAAGWASARFIPAAVSKNPQLRVNLNLPGETLGLIAQATENRSVWRSILGISWFCAMGVVILALIPSYTREVLNADESVATAIMVLFTLGIAAGALLCNAVLKNEISGRIAPYAAAGMTVSLVDLYLVSTALPPAAGAVLGLGEIASAPHGWRLALDFAGASVFGGLFVVPLYAIIQHRSAPEARARIIAANNVLNAVFVTGATAVSAAMLWLGYSVTQVILTAALLNGVATAVVFRLIPDQAAKTAVRAILKLFYRVEVDGLERYTAAGPRALVVGNHVSFLDAAILAAYLPEKPVFAINTQTALAWWVRPFLKLVDAFPLDPTKPMAVKALAAQIRQNRHCVIFPEGRLTVTGGLMKVYEGASLIAERTRATIVPVRIDGAQFTPFSRMGGKLRLRWFPKIRIKILPPRALVPPGGESARARRRARAEAMYDVMSDMMFETSPQDGTLFAALLDARHTHGRKLEILEDADRNRLTYDDLAIRSLILGRALDTAAPGTAPVGLMLPNSNAAAVVFFGLQAVARVPAMLNFSTGHGPLLSSVKAAGVTSVVTSRRFEAKAKLTDTVDALREAGVAVLYLEDVAGRITWREKLRAVLRIRLWGRGAASRGIRADDPAVILFTSGSEGMPKGVVLSHRNLTANRDQLSARVDFNSADKVFNALPMFHSFGLTGGTLLPLLSGVPTFLYPSPLHFKVVPALVYDTSATILFGTDTFLAGYGRAADAYDFYSLRYVFAGAERVRDETRALWNDRFGLRLLEGYGATETGPVIAVNTPMHFRAGTVGRVLPGLETRLEPVPGISEGGRLLVRGPNVMLGYLLADAPGVLQPPPDGWYDTGDIVSVAPNGFVTIRGRAKRFAKIAGEMVSLAAVEALAAEAAPEGDHAVLAVSDDRKGERLILISERARPTRDGLLLAARKAGMSELTVPKDIRAMDSLPRLATGKVDYAALFQWIGEGG